MRNDRVFILIPIFLLVLTFQKTLGGNDHALNKSLINTNDSTSKKKKDTVKDEKDRMLALELDYGSNQTYKGRKSNEKQPYYSPVIEYEAPSGFFIYTSFTNIID